MPTDTANVHVGWVSLSMSNSSGVFAIPPELTITFASVHSTNGITVRGLQYSNDFANSVTVQYYDSSSTLIREDTYLSSSWELKTEQAVSNFKVIVLTFNSTNKPYRYLRVTSIDYGELSTFTGADIKSANVVERVDPLCVELPIGTCDLSLISTSDDFSIISPTGNYETFQYKEPFSVAEIVGNDQYFIGQFYLDDWENKSDKEVLLKCMDMIGILDTLPYRGGIWLDGTKTAQSLISDILGAISAPYDLDTTLNSIIIIGWIPVCTYREALQQIAFAIGAYVSCSRSGTIQIYKTILADDVTSPAYTITKAQKGIDQLLTLKTLVTGAEITAHNYLPNSDAVELYNGSLVAGTHTIEFSEPAHDLTITGGTITESGANYATITVASAGTVVLSGQGYTDTTQVYGVYNTTLSTNTKTNIISIKEATLVSSANVVEVTQRVYDYYQQRYLQTVKLYQPTAEVGKSVLIDTLYDQKIKGVMEKMKLNLSGGFTAECEITGVVNE
jgi:hypothetical protein